MPAPLRITLTDEEDSTLEDLSYANNVPRRTKQRAIALRLNADGWKVLQIAEYFEWAEQTVRETIHRWQQYGLAGLWEARGRGKPRRGSDADWQKVEQWLAEPRRRECRSIKS